MKEMQCDRKEFGSGGALVRRVGVRASAVGRAAQARPLNVGSSFGFTLIELMVAIALVVVIMVGVGKVFKLTSDTVGGGMAISSMARDDRAAQVTMQNDFAGAASDSPVFMILSERTGAFLTAADKSSDVDGNPMTVANYQGVETDTNPYNHSPQGSQIAASLYGDRNHRVDRIGFFARGQFVRQTANDNTAFTPSPPATTSEAYIWYGHVRMPGTLNNQAAATALTTNSSGADDVSSNLTPAYPLPGYKSNTANQPDYDNNNYGCYENNPIASNWVLGRYAMGLMDFNAVLAASGRPDPIYCLLATAGAPNNVALAPLGVQTQVLQVKQSAGNAPQIQAPSTGTGAPYYPIGSTSGSPSSGPCYIYTGRYDLAATTIGEFRSIVTGAFNSQLNGALAYPWWWPMVYEGDFTGAAPVNPPTTPPQYVPPTHGVALRYECNPYVDRPITGTGMAGTVPYFVPHVTQFIVEFAGDYLTQDDPMPVVASGTYGAGTPGYIEDVKPDGKLDFYYDKSADSSARQTQTNLWVRKIRWYGLPRDTGGFTVVNTGTSRVVGPDGTIPSPTPTNFTLNTIDPNSFVDVLPLRDIEKMAALITTPPSFEVDPANLIQRNDYAKPNLANSNAVTDGMAGNEHYYCIWRNGAPKLVRILMKIDDPNSRVRQGRWIEQVFAVQ